MKLSVFLDHILQAKEQTGKSLEELLWEVREAGIEAVEMHLEYLMTHEEILELLEKAGLKICSIYENYEMERHTDREKAYRHINAALEAGAEKILVVPGFLHGEEAEQMQARMGNREDLEAFFERSESIQRMAEGLRFISEEGNKKGIAVTVEDFDNPSSPLSGVYGVHWFLKQAPHLCYTFDTGNYLYYGEDLMEVLDLLGERIVHVHCKDRIETGGNPFTEDCPSVILGTGYIPFEALTGRLKETGYQGYLSIEHFGVEDQEGCIRKSAAFLKRMI